MRMFTLAIFLTIAGVQFLTAQQRPPNIIVIFSDDHTRQAISAYGGTLMQTPGIDRIAREGAILQRAYVTNSICSPSRAVFLTGKYSHINGLRDNSAGRSFDGSQQQIQKLLKTKNYQTAWIGKWHLQSLPQGFDYWTILPDQGNYFQPAFIHMNKDTVKHQGYVTDLISAFSLQWLQQRDTSKPFFLVVGEKATHRNWMPAVEDLGAFDDKTFPLPPTFWDNYEGREAAKIQDMTINKTMILRDDLKIDVDYTRPGMFGRMSDTEKEAYKKYYDAAELAYEKVKHDSVALAQWKYQRYLRDYLSTAKGMDRNITKILDAIDAMGLRENTIVIYTSDQGFYLGEHGWFDKRFMYEESFSTPFVIRYPGHIKPGTSVNDLVMNLDIAPTLLSYAGVKVPEDIQGESIKPLLEGKPVKGWREYAYYHYYEYPLSHKVAKHFGVSSDRYKLIYYYDPVKSWELFDLKKDPREMKNVYQDPAYQKVVATMKKQLIKAAKQYKDDEAVGMLLANSY
ncbi:MAG: sulfatase [Chitinophagaceae bacterium]